MEFSLDFSKRLIESAKYLEKNKPKEKEAGRAILYLSLVSCEISIKALLEKAGYPIKDLKHMSHDFSELKKAIAFCKFKGSKKGTGAKIFSKVPDKVLPTTTVGVLLDFEKTTASKYPNRIRYGRIVKHYPAVLMLKCAIKVHKWVEKNLSDIKRMKASDFK